MIELSQQFIVALMGGIAAGLVAWGALRTEIRFLWRDQRRLEGRVDLLERRRSTRAPDNYFLEESTGEK